MSFYLILHYWSQNLCTCTCTHVNTHNTHRPTHAHRHSGTRATDHRAEALRVLTRYNKLSLEFIAIVFLIKISKELSVFTVSPAKAIFTLLII